MRLAWAPLGNGRQISTVLILGGVYFAAAKLGLKLAFIHPSATPVWPPTGIALASLLLLGYHAWPGIFLGAFLASLTTEGTVWTSLGIATGSTLEGLIGAYLVNGYANGKKAFTRPQDIFTFALLGAVVSTTVSATIGVTSLALGGFARWAHYGPIWLTWWLGDAAGALIVAPVLILWSTRPRPRLDARAVLERALFLLTLLSVGWIVFGGVFAFAYLTVPFLVWAAFRFDQRETATVIFLLAVIAIWGTIKGLGPFVAATPNAALLLLQVFMGIMVLVALPLGSVVAERHNVAETLQRALLPVDLPQVPGIGIHAIYIPGAREAEIGGDWYDVFRLPDGHIAVSVGDVVGRGLQAAVIMGQLRQAIRAAALEGHAPEMVLNQANKVLQLTSPEEGMATAIVGVLEPATLTFTYAVAGHPAPVLAAPDGRIEILEAGDTLPLGAGGPGLPSPRTVTLAQGSLLVLYTDGLIESTRNINEGEAALRSAVGAELQRPSADPARAILNRVLGGCGAEDDVAIVALSIAPQPLQGVVLALPAVPASAREVRHAFQRLADAQGLDRDRAALFEVALGEAVNNVVEHAYGAARGSLSVRVWREGDALIAEIEDHGRWRKERSEGRGYGLQIMRAVADSVRVERGPSGTVVRLTLAHATSPIPSQTDGSAPPAGEPLKGAIDQPVKAGEGQPMAVTSTRRDGQFLIEQAASVPVVRVRGDVDVANAHELEAVLEDAARTDKRAVVVDLAGTSFLDSKAMHILLRLAERLGTNRQRLLIVIPQDRLLRRVLEIMGVTQALSVFDSLDKALAGMARGGGAENRV